MEQLEPDHEPRHWPDDRFSSNTWGPLPPRSYFRFDAAAIESERESRETTGTPLAPLRAAEPTPRAQRTTATAGAVNWRGLAASRTRASPRRRGRRRRRPGIDRPVERAGLRRRPARRPAQRPRRRRPRAPRRHRGVGVAVGLLAVDAARGLAKLVHRRVGHRRARPGRADGVRTHTERSVVDGDRLREHDQRGLGGAVGGAARSHAARRRRGDRHDRAAAFEQRRQRRPGDQEGAVEIGAHHRAPALGRLLEHRPGVRDPRVQDDAVHSAPSSRAAPPRRSASAILPGRAQSPGTAIAPGSSPASAASGCGRRPLIATRSPWPAKRRAQAAPIPLPPPVISTFTLSALRSGTCSRRYARSRSVSRSSTV